MVRSATWSIGRSRRWRVAAGAIAVILALGACGDDDADQVGPGNGTESPTEDDLETPDDGADHDGTDADPDEQDASDAGPGGEPLETGDLDIAATSSAPDLDRWCQIDDDIADRSEELARDGHDPLTTIFTDPAGVELVQEFLVTTPEELADAVRSTLTAMQDHGLAAVEDPEFAAANARIEDFRWEFCDDA